MADRRLIATGVIAAALAALCCAAPFLVAALGALGLTLWFSKVVDVMIPVLAVWLAVLGFGLYRKRLHRG